MACELSLVVGLGNPGPDYEQTRHNAGFWFADALARAMGVSWQHDRNLPAELARGVLESCDLRLCKPLGYMNRSGASVAAHARYYRIPVERILVVHDDLDLPPGIIRYKEGGGHGGHNGLRDLIRHLGGNGFRRLRLGIGHPGHRDQVVNYVLQRPTAEEEARILEAVNEGVRVLSDLMAGRTQQAVQRIHGRRVDA